MRSVRLAGRSRCVGAAQLARELDVLLHLLDQGLGGVETALTPEASQEIDPERLPVQVDVTIEQVRLDEHPPPGSERGTHPDVDRGADAVGPGGVDPVAGTYEVLLRDDVGGREPERPPSAIPTHNL